MTEKNKNAVVAALTLSLSACASLSQEPSWSAPENNDSRVLIYRVSGSHSSAVNAYFGTQEHYVVGIRPNQYSVVTVPSGEHSFRVGSGSSSSAVTINATLTPDETLCLKVKSNPAQWIGAIIPLLAIGIPTFNSEIVECPDQEELSEFALVESV